MIRISFVKFVTLGFPVNARDKRLMNPMITPNAPKIAPETGAAVATTVMILVRGEYLISFQILTPF